MQLALSDLSDSQNKANKHKIIHLEHLDTNTKKITDTNLNTI